MTLLTGQTPCRLSFGRKPILRASFASIAMSICWSCFVIGRPDLMPVEFTLFASLFAVFGGGVGTAMTVIHAIIADVATDKSVPPFFPCCRRPTHTVKSANRRTELRLSCGRP